MNDRCFIGNLRIILDFALEDGGCQRDKNVVLLSTLSKVQRSLNSSTSFSSSAEKFTHEVEDCALSKEVGRLCIKDLEGLSSNLVGLLAPENNFTNYAVGKTLVALCDYLHDATSLWAFVMNFIWKTLRTCFGDAEDALINPKSLNEGVTSLCLPAKHGSSTFGYNVAMHLFQVLHDILRKFKQEGASMLNRYLENSATNIPKVLQAFTTCFKHLFNNPVKHNFEEEDLMLAALLRFLCSFSHSISVHLETIDTSKIIAESQVLGSVNGFLAAYSHHCLDIQHSHRLSHYLHHKFLMLMFRLHEWFIKWPSLAITCSDILKSNMVTLCPALFQKRTQLSAPSMLSPFAPCLVHTKIAESLPTCQPERHAIFLIFKVESLLRKIPCGSSLRSEVGSASTGYSAEWQGEQWMLNWLLSHIKMAENMWSSGTTEIADYLASSFLQIFVDEDTLILEMLLLLQDNSLSHLYSGFVDTGHNFSQEAQKLLVDVLKPLRLFAVFLSLVSYDHSVIMDFLISKDTSILCLQYLLRCMRMVRSTWPELLSLSHPSHTQHTRKDSFDQSKDLEAKPTIHGNTSNANQPFVSDAVIDINRVGTCLMNLKHVIQRLHLKHAFPYNPSPLLKHLDAFERLWLCDSRYTG
eukprot:c19375_g1_i2 orf=78-1988(+)